MSKKIHSSNGSNSKTINLIFISLIIIFMLCIPFYRGLFFRENYIPSVMVVGFMFATYAIYKFLKGCPITLNTYMDIAFVSIPMIYLISFFFSVNSKDAFDQFLIYSAYFMLYKVSSVLVQENNKYKKYFINGIILSTFLLSLTSILDIMGIIDLQLAFLGNRLYGLYQYPNTTASVLGVGIVLTLNTIINEKNIRRIPIYQIVLTAIIASFVFTLSRGAYLIVAGVMLFNFLVIDARKKLKYVMGMIISILSSVYLIYKFYTLPEVDLSQIGSLYMYALLLSGVGALLIHSFARIRNINISNRVINIILISLVILLVGFTVFLLSSKNPIEYRVEHIRSEEKSWKYATINLYDLEPSKDYTIDFDVLSSKENEYSYGVIMNSYDETGEAVEILREFGPVNNDINHKSLRFKTLEYTKRVQILLHNYETDSYTLYKNIVIKDSIGEYNRRMEKLTYLPEVISNRLMNINLESTSSSMRISFAKDGLEIIKDHPLLGAGGGAWKNLYRQYQSIPYNTTETHNYYVQYGTEVGIIGLLALAALLLIFMLNMYKAVKSNSEFISLYIAALLLLLHSTIDFNLSLVAVGYLLWLLMGISSVEDNLHRMDGKNSNILVYSVLLFSFIITLCASSIYYGMRIGGQVTRIVSEKKDIKSAIELYEKASNFDRYNGIYRINLAQLMNNQLRKTNDRKYLDEFSKQISMLHKYEPYNHQYTSLLCSMYLAIGDFDEASRLAEKRLQEEPLVTQSYMLLIDINYEIAQYYLKNSEMKESDRVQEAIPHFEKIMEIEKKFGEVNKAFGQPLKLDGDYPKKMEAASKVLDMIKADKK